MMRAMCYKASRNKCYLTLLVISATLLITYNSKFDKGHTGSKYSFSMFTEPTFSEPTQEEIDYFAKHVEVTMAVEDNFITGEKMGGRGFYIASVSLANTGKQVVKAKRWQLYGYFMRLIEKDDYPYPTGFHLSSCGLKVYHVEGSLFRFEPDGWNFAPLEPYSRLTCRFKGQAFSIARSDFMPRWYVTSGTTMPKIVANTDDETLSFVKDFTEENQYKRRADDKSHPFSPQERYDQFYTGDDEVVSRLNIIPTPLSMQINEKLEMEFNTNQWVIVKSDPFLQEVKHFSDELTMKIVNSRPMRKFIEIKKAPVRVNMDGTDLEHEDAYNIEAVVEKEHIVITAATNQAVFYAFKTLCSVFFTPVARESVGIPVMIPGFTIKDAPRFPYRGLHIDVSRNFIGVKEIFKIIDVLAMYKMNKLHLHLSDDEGWRLEIPGMPELTQVGSARCHDPKEEQCILPMLGSGPFSNTSGSGYFSVGDYREILVYAKKRHIEVIPEIDMPGHSYAAVKSIHSNAQQAIRKGMDALKYSVIDTSAEFQPMSSQHFTGGVLNPCMDSTYRFVKKVITEVKKMHEDIQPLKFYHFGGDEVAMGAWDDSPECEKLKSIRGENMNQFDLMKYFINNLTRIASEESMSVGAWEDGMISHDLGGIGIPFPRDSFKNKDIYVYVWKRPTEPRTPHRAKLFANKGYKVILAYGSYLYFDHPYEPDPEERGLYWATRKISTLDAWEFSPAIMFNDNHLECPGAIVNSEECFKLLKPENIMGIQAELWTETVRSDEQAEYMLFPRLLAVAERAWHKGAFENPEGIKSKSVEWTKFANAVGYHELPRLDKMGVRYRVPPPGAIVSAGKAKFRTEFPGLDIEYFSPVLNSWKPVSHDMFVDHSIRIRTRSADGKRFSREVILNPFVTNGAEPFFFHKTSRLYNLIFISLYLYFTNIILLFPFNS